jgi:hypothetical protein
MTARDEWGVPDWLRPQDYPKPQSQEKWRVGLGNSCAATKSFGSFG